MSVGMRKIESRIDINDSRSKSCIAFATPRSIPVEPSNKRPLMFNEAVKLRGGKMAAAVTLQVPFGSCTRKTTIIFHLTLARCLLEIIKHNYYILIS